MVASFLSWFNEYNPKHILAYKVLQESGKWPEGFIPEGIIFEPSWQISLAFRLADAWILHITTISGQ